MAFDAGRARVLAFLEAAKLEARKVNTAEVSHPDVGGHEGTRRLRELRDAGHPVQCKPAGDGSGYWLYWLGDPEPDAQGNLFEMEDALS